MTIDPTVLIVLIVTALALSLGRASIRRREDPPEPDYAAIVRAAEQPAPATAPAPQQQRPAAQTTYIDNFDEVYD